MAQIGATLRTLRSKFGDCIGEEDYGIPIAAAMAAFDRATTDLLAEIVDGVQSEPVQSEPAKPKQVRRPRGPNKNKAGAETDTGATE